MLDNNIFYEISLHKINLLNYKMAEISDKKLKIINYIEHLSLQLLAHKNNKVNKEEGVYCDTIEEANEAINDMLPDDITEELYEIYKTQVEEICVEKIDNDFVQNCADKINNKINAL